jgi:hypothetical protein
MHAELGSVDRFTAELAQIAAEAAANSLLSYVVPIIHSHEAVQALEEGIIQWTGGNAFRMDTVDIKALVDAVLAACFPIRKLELRQHAITNAGVQHICALMQVTAHTVAHEPLFTAYALECGS